MSFDIARSGINAVNAQLDTISNNIANAGTFGFKSSRANFSSMYAGSQPTGTEVSSLTQSIDVGGSVLTTGRDLDASIRGRGFFVSRAANGATLYSRVGIFSVDRDGYLSDAMGGRVQGFAAVPGSTALGALGDLRVPNGQVAASATDAINWTGNLSADWTAPSIAFDPANPLTFNSSIVSVVYDSLGVQHSVTQYFVKTATNQVTTHYGFDGAIVAGATAVLDFGADGQLAAINGVTPPPPVPAPPGYVPVFAPVSVALGTPTGAAPLTIAVDYNGTTQFAGDSTTLKNDPNGYASGTLIGVQIEDDGAVVANYSNGQNQRIGTVALATFPDEGALSPVSGTAWAATGASGGPLFFAPGSGMAGTLYAGALEQSNVDITTELVGLMSAQRNYQANAKVISTESQMVQALMQAI